jgi:hypothetical protein
MSISAAFQEARTSRVAISQRITLFLESEASIRPSGDSARVALPYSIGRVPKSFGRGTSSPRRPGRCPSVRARTSRGAASFWMVPAAGMH